MNTKKVIVIAAVAVTLLTSLAIASLGGSETSDNNNGANTATAEQAPSSTQAEAAGGADTDLLTYLDTEAQQYNDMKQYLSGPEYDEFFIANMIHFSEGLQQLEELAAKSTNKDVAEGAAERASNAQKNVDYYKQLQKDKGLGISYGDNMQYHGAMGADSAVYFAVSSLEGLSGQAYEDELMGQLEEFRMNVTMIAAVGLDAAVDTDVKDLVRKELLSNKQGLDVLKGVS